MNVIYRFFLSFRMEKYHLLTFDDEYESFNIKEIRHMHTNTHTQSKQNETKKNQNEAKPNKIQNKEK